MRLYQFSSLLAAASLRSHSPAWAYPVVNTISKNMHHAVWTNTRRLLSLSLGPNSAIVSDHKRTEELAIAEGSIVSFFPGGLSAIRLKDDSTGLSSQSVASPIPVIQSTHSGISCDLQGKTVKFLDGALGCVVAHRPPLVFVYSDVVHEPFIIDGMVQVLNSKTTVKVVPSECVVEIFPVDRMVDYMERAIFSPTPKIEDIALINSPMLTGVTMIDSLCPIGRGQNMLLIGHNLHDMRGYSMDFIQTQIRDGTGAVKCVYACTERSRDEVLQQLDAAGISRSDVHVIAPTSSFFIQDEESRAAQAVMIVATACAVGEVYAIEKQMNAVVIVDTIDLHKTLWDVTTRTLVDLYGVDSVVKGDLEGIASSEMRSFYSSLIQRSCQYKNSRGGGSVSTLLLTKIPSVSSNTDDQVFDESVFDYASNKIKDRINVLMSRKIPLTAETLRKIDIPVPTDHLRRLALQHVDDLMSMSDGQIWFDEAIESYGQRPPLDPKRSFTRIGIGADTESRADAAALRRIATRLRLEFSQASSLEGAGDSVTTQRQLKRKKSLLLAMHQLPGSGGRRLSESCVALLAAQKGFLDHASNFADDTNTESGLELIQRLLKHVSLEAPEVMTEVDDCLDLNYEAKKKLTRAIETFFIER